MKKIYLSLAALAIVACCFISFTKANLTDDRPITAGKAEVVETVANVNGKVLVTYFTSPETDGVDAVSGASRVIANGDLYGNTQYIAKVISDATKSELFEIKTSQPYPGGHKELIDVAKKEIDSNARPKLATHIKNLKDYDIIFVGFPNWWYDMPTPIYSFFNEYDFSGKTIIPFCTHGGSRFSQAEKTIASLEKNAKMVKGLAISRDNVEDAKPRVLKWLREIGLMK